ncbi:hypothetical protein NQ315_005875 [Exocentrus adspersus]|uniref:Amidase domain-containing protein n=1 Tax=Exocentrus adspersus TaxID=1586481 RepID=A0AAV8VRI7_9CUCU|nr:hypothetical protein NQ315_005875 [Exocentrus adspersus]
MSEIRKETKVNRGKCNIFKTMLLYITYFVNLMIDKIFGYFYDSRRIQIQKCVNPIIMSSATSLARKIRNQELTSQEVVQAFINRIREVNPILNAVVDDRFEEALEEAREIDKDIQTGHILDMDYKEKPFLGVPFTTKESTAVKGLSHTFGLVRRKGRKASFDADYVSLMKQAGGICLGVTNIPQFNLWQETSNPLFGVTNNPYNTTRNVGGSSGGEASILAAGGIPVSIGTDIGGSCRIPAFMCGVFGHKPSSHLISTKGMTFRTGKEEQTMVAVGTLTRYVEDITPLLKVLVAENINKLKLDHPVDVKKLKIYYVTDPKDAFVCQFRDEMKSTFASAVNYFTEICSHKPQEVEFEGTKYTRKLWKFWMSKESDANFKKDIMNREEEANPLTEVLKHFTIGGDYTTATIFNFVNTMLPCPDENWAVRETDKLRKQITEKLKDNGVLLYPSAPWPASYHHTALLRPWNFNLFAIWNVLKFPVTQVPMGLKMGYLSVYNHVRKSVCGLPVSSLMAKSNTDPRLISLIEISGAYMLGSATVTEQQIIDGMSDGVQFFEGVEKLLEIWFTTSDSNNKAPDLRKIPRTKLESLLKIVRCEIISFVKNEQIDAYVLSESSMFISKRRFILKTCGTTTPLLCLQPLLLLAEQYAGFTEVEDLFYSRKNFKRPDLQVTPHQHFDQEVALLDTLFPDGAAYCLGAVNKDCWYLYTLNPLPQRDRMLTLPESDQADQTLEILMTDLDPDIMAIFTKEECLNATEATKKSGIDKIIPNLIIDDFLLSHVDTL